MMRTPQLEGFLRQSGLEPSALNANRFIESFLSEMRLGASGGESSLAMLPTYLSGDSGLPGDAWSVAIDAGGTNFRAALLHVAGGRAEIEDFASHPMPGTQGEVSWDEFISFAASCVRPYLAKASRIGVCISFPTEIGPGLDGTIKRTTKEVRLAGYEGRHVCADLVKALGVPGVRAALLNDTTAVLLSGLAAGAESGGLVGLINGTGTNLCCQAAGSDLGLDFPGRMIVDVESGGFVPPERGRLDVQLDKQSAQPGVYLAEKMVSGAYLGELCRLAFQSASRSGVFTEESAGFFLALDRLPTPEADAFGAGGALPGLSNHADAELAQEIVRAVFERAAKHIACALASVVKFGGTGSDGLVTVSADGSVFRKSALFRPALERYALRYVPARSIRYVEMENSTLIGTAVGGLMA